jgi:outer membrane protein assembly factor BamB
MPTAGLKRSESPHVRRSHRSDGRLRKPMQQSLAVASAALVASLATAAEPGVRAVRARACGPQRRPASVARIVRAVDLPGYRGLIDPNGRTIYLVRDISGTSREIVAFDWRRRGIAWRAPDEGPLWPAAVSPLALILANYAQGGPVTFAPLAGLDRRTGRIRWRQPNAALAREGAIGIAVVGDRIVKALPGRLVCLSAASGREVWVRDFGSQMARIDWPYPPAAAARSVFAQVVVEGTRAVALKARDGDTRWSHVYPWTVSFEGPPTVRRVGPLAAAGSWVVALIPTGPQKPTPDLAGQLPPPSALYCWNARTGGLLWRQSAPWTNDHLLITRSLVALSPDPGVLIAYSLADGRELWRFDGHLANWPAPWLAVGREIVLSGVTVAGGTRITGAFVLAVDSATGKLKWRVRLPRATDVNALSLRRGGAQVLVIAEEHPFPGPWRARLYAISVARPHQPAGDPDTRKYHFRASRLRKPPAGQQSERAARQWARRPGGRGRPLICAALSRRRLTTANPPQFPAGHEGGL